VGGLRAQETFRGIKYYSSVTILGITFWATIDQTTKDTWARITGKVRMQAKKAYDRDPCLARRIQYVHNGLLAKLWYTAQILPLTGSYTQQLITAVTWYIWKGAVFRVKLSTLQRPKRMGGMGLIDIAAKCRALLLYRMYLQGHNDGTITVAWMLYWTLTGRQKTLHRPGRSLGNSPICTVMPLTWLIYNRPNTMQPPPACANICIRPFGKWRSQ
jgi:hypothetical protein